MKPDDKICYCFHVTKRKIMNFIRIHEPRVPSQISECGGAGTGCGWCIPYLKRCFEESRTKNAVDQELTAEQYARMRAEYIRSGKGKPAAGAEPLPEED